MKRLYSFYIFSTAIVLEIASLALLYQAILHA